MNITLRPEIEAMRGEIIENRRHLHQHPELGLQEHETAKFINEKLNKFIYHSILMDTIIPIIAPKIETLMNSTVFEIGV